MQHRHLSASHRRIFLILVLILLIGGLVVSGLWMTNALGWRGYRLSDVEAFIGAELPDNTTDAQFLTEDETARIVWLRFSIVRDDELTTFIQNMIPDGETQDGSTPFPNPNYKEASIEWWTPQEAQEFSGLHAIHNDRVYEILVDRTDGIGAVVYLRVYEL